MPFQFLEKTFLKEREGKTDRQTKRRGERHVSTESRRLRDETGRLSTYRWRDKEIDG
jgi:hypothetical protein